NTALSQSPLYFSENTDFEATGNDWMGNIVFDGETGTPANPGLFANNFVRAGFCLELYYAFNLQVYNNSLRGSAGAIYSSNLNLPDLKNNILYGQSYCFWGNDNFTSSVSDNNCLYSGSGNIAWVGGTIYETLEDWQTYTGSESNSFVADPMFFSDQDLHVCNELLDGVGLDLDGIDVDFDGEPRPIGNLDIGADEFDLLTCGCTLSASIELISDYNGQAISCFGQDDATLQVNVEGENGEVSIIWNNEWTESILDNIGAGDYSCTVADDNCMFVAEFEVIEPAELVLEITEVVQPNCDNPAAGYIFYQASGGTGNLAWTWTNDVSFDASAEFLEGGAYVTSITDENSCTTSSSVELDEVVIPEIMITGESAICINDSTLLSANGATQVQWLDDLGELAEIWVSPTVTTEYSVIGTSATGCTSEASFVVSVNQLPEVTLEQVAIETCASDDLIDLSEGIPAGGTYFGTGVEGSQFNTSIAGSGEHAYSYTYTDEFGCSNTALGSIEVFELPEVILADFQDSVLCLDGLGVDLPIALPSGGVYTGSGVDGDQFSPMVAGVGEHVITYTYTDSNGCVNSASTSIQVEICIGFDRVESADEVMVYPNPNQGYVIVQSPISTSFQLFLTDGRLVQEGRLSRGNNTLDFSNLGSGVYILKVGSKTVEVVRE
ncbi:MAG: T9SS type A sorting domain-containing protein, partial [Flavobacteriales bacterium]|nr:T9SS type A sorting domain-containing protein [Flavobacteriales bacterium]